MGNLMTNDLRIPVFLFLFLLLQGIAPIVMAQNTTDPIQRLAGEWNIPGATTSITIYPNHVVQHSRWGRGDIQHVNAEFYNIYYRERHMTCSYLFRSYSETEIGLLKAENTDPPECELGEIRRAPWHGGIPGEVSQIWLQIKESKDPAIFEAFRREYGPANSVYDVLAAERITELRRASLDLERQHSELDRQRLEIENQRRDIERQRRELENQRRAREQPVSQPGGEQLDKALLNQIERFIAEEHLQGKDHFSSQVDYFDKGVVSREFAIQDVAKYARKWPIRFYKLVPGSLKVSANGDSRYAAVFEYEFRVANDTKLINGRGYSKLYLAIDNGRFVVTGVKEIVQK